MQAKSKLNLMSAVVTDRGLSEKRPHNEDSYLELPDLGVFAVADGVGGAQAGDVASQMAVEILAEAFNNQPPNSDAEDVMRLAIERANSAIFQMAADLPQLSSMATTMVALQVAGNIATIGHVGDSRLYRIDSHGKLHRETDDHSVVEEEVRAGRMTADQALNHPSRNVISRALGAEETVEVDLKTIMIEPGTFFLLCSDGITRHIPDREIEDLFISEIEPERLAARMREICYDRGAEDNLTAVVVRVPSALGDDRSSSPIAAAAEPDNLTDHTDEDTVATARPVSTKNNRTVETFDDLVVDDLDDESYLSDELSELVDDDDSSGYVSESLAVPASPVPEPAVPQRAELPSYEIAEESAGGGVSRILSSIFLLVLGAAVGAGMYYMFVPKPEPLPAPPALVEKSPDVSLTAFEESRRLIDKDPASFINANAASPQVPEDYFLLGRAFLLSGKYWEAKRAFIEARNRLAQADPKNAKTLSAEIAMALALIETPGAAESFAKDIAAASIDGGTVSNANSAVNAVPAR